MTEDIEDTLLIFSRDDLETSIERGGVAWWKVNIERAKNCKFLVVCKNGGHDHRTATYIVKINDFDIANGRDQDPTRKIILFNEYDTLNIPNVWPGYHNPVAYTNLKSLGINPNKLDWKKTDVGLERAIRISNENPQRPNYEEDGIDFDTAKRLIAKKFNVKPASVKITIEA